MCAAVDQLYTHCLVAPEWLKLLNHRGYLDALQGSADRNPTLKLITKSVSRLATRCSYETKEAGKL